MAWPGPYLVLPFRGPTAVRDLAGNYIDGFFSPLYYMHVQFTGKQYVGLVKSTIGSVDNRANNIVTYRDIERNSVDFYATMRDYYRQRRERQVEDNPVQTAVLAGFLAARFARALFRPGVERASRGRKGLKPPASMPIIERIVNFCCRHAVLTVAGGAGC